MGSTVYYKGFDPSCIAGQIDGILLGVIRSILVVFFLFVAVVSFVFAVTLTTICLFAAGLHLMLRIISHRPETQRLFADAGC